MSGRLKGPTAPSRLSRSTNRSRPPKRALVHSFYYISGVPYVDATPVQGAGRILHRIPVLQSGGGADTFLHVPIPVSPKGVPDPATSPHVLIIFDDDGAPAAIGLIPRRQKGAQQQSGAVTPADEDEPEEHSVNEFRYQQGTAALGLTDKGGWYMQPGLGGTIRMQLPRGGVFRVSEDGEAEDSVAVAGATEDHVGRLGDIVNAQTALINRLLVALDTNTSTSAVDATKTIAAAARLGYVPEYIEEPRGRFASRSIKVSADTVAGTPVDDSDTEEG